MLQHNGLTIHRTLEELVTPDQVALIVYDMQVGIVGQVAQGEAVTARVKQVLDAARRARIRTFFTRHMTLPKELMGVSQYRMWMAWQRKEDPAEVQSPFLRDSPGFPIVEELRPLASEAIFDKLAMSAFEGTPLTFALRDCGLRAFIIAGIALEIGIDPTCRHGADLGFIPILVEDACGAGNSEVAAKAFENLSFLGDTIVTNTDTICGLLTEDARQQ
jgi:nicotinamidase-related amidase